jgi:hypothetical protein
MSGLRLAADIYLAPQVSGASAGYLVGPINQTKLEFSQDDGEEIIRQSWGRDTYGQALNSTQIPGVQRLALSGDECSTELLAFALMGTTEAVSQASATGTAETITVKALDRWIKLGKHQISTVVVKNDDNGSPGATTYTLGTHYDMDLTTGAIQVISGAGIALDAILHLTYNVAATAGTRILGGTQTEMKCQVLIDGINQATQKAVRGVVHEVGLKADGAIDLAGDAFVEWSLSGVMVTPSGKTSPFTLDFDD